MEVLRDGSFMLNLPAEMLARGLRPSAKMARDKEYLVKCAGAVGYDNVLQVIEDLELKRIATELAITDGFPYPQIFVCKEVIIVCGLTAIYEYHSLTAKLTSIPAGLTWTCIDYGKFIYLSNCTVAVIRDAMSGEYHYADDYPTEDYRPCRAGCDNNGQAVISPCPLYVAGSTTLSPTTIVTTLTPTTIAPEEIILPLDNYWQQGIDPGDDGYVTAAALNRDGDGLVFFQEEIATEVNDYFDYVDSFPLTVNGFDINNITDLPPSARRETNFQFVVFVAQEVDSSYGIFIDSYRNGVVRTRKVFGPSADDFDYAFVDGNMAEGYSDGVVVVAYLTSTTIDPGLPSESYENQIHIMRSTDYGLTWTDTIIHNEDYDFTDYDPPTLIKGEDGNLYILSSVTMEHDYTLFGYSWTTGQRVYFIAKSVDKGLTWTFKVVHTYDPLVDGWDIIDNQHICASDDTIYVGTAPRVFGGVNSVIIYASTDGGDNWTAYQHDEYGSYVTISAHGINLLLNCGAKIYKSTNAGLTFSEVYTIPQLVYYCLMRSEGSVFAFTGCGLNDGSGDRELSWYLSTDDGDNWAQRLFNIDYNVTGDTIPIDVVRG